MVKVDKLIKFNKHPSKATKLAKLIETKGKITKSQQTGIKSYKRKLIKNLSKNTTYVITKNKKSKSKSKSKLNSKLKSKTKNSLTKKHKNKNDKEVLKISKIVYPDEIKIPKMSKFNQLSTNKMSMQNNQIIQKVSNISALDDKYVIAIPSYKRSDIIQTHTLAILNKHNIKPSCITIFVADQAEYDIYKSTVPAFLYNDLVIGVKGLKNQRNFINQYYIEGKHVVEMDDDIKAIMQLVVKMQTRQTSKKNIGKTVKPIEDLDAFIRRAFEICTENNIFLWGVYPLINPYFMTYKMTTDLRFIVGPMWGMINRHRNDLKLTVDEKENSERTLQFWVADGAVLRFNNIGIETKYYKNKGGMQAEEKDRKVEALKSVYYLNKMYPTLTKVSLTKKNGMPEIKMNRKTSSI